jgi:hypothetical protein
MIFQYVTRLDSVSFPSPHSNNKLVLDQHYERGFDPKLLGRFICIGCSSAAAVATRRSSSFGVCRTAIMRWRPLGTYRLASAFYLTFYQLDLRGLQPPEQAHRLHRRLCNASSETERNADRTGRWDD